MGKELSFPLPLSLSPPLLLSLFLSLLGTNPTLCAKLGILRSNGDGDSVIQSQEGEHEKDDGQEKGLRGGTTRTDPVEVDPEDADTDTDETNDSGCEKIQNDKDDKDVIQGKVML